MGLDFKDILRGLGGGATAVSGLMQEDRLREHQEKLLRLRSGLDNYYAEKRAKSQRQFLESMEQTRHKNTIELNRIEENNKSDVMNWGSLYGADYLRKGMASKNMGLVMQSLNVQRLSAKLSGMEELAPEEKQFIGTLPGDLQGFMMKSVATGQMYRETRNLRERQIQSTIDLNKSNELRNKALLEQLKDSPYGYNPIEQDKILSAQIAKIMKWKENPVWQGVERHLADVEVGSEEYEKRLAELESKDPMAIETWKGISAVIEADVLVYQQMAARFGRMDKDLAKSQEDEEPKKPTVKQRGIGKQMFATRESNLKWKAQKKHNIPDDKIVSEEDFRNAKDAGELERFKGMFYWDEKAKKFLRLVKMKSGAYNFKDI